MSEIKKLWSLWLIGIGLVGILLIVVIWVATPNFVHRNSQPRLECINNLRQLDAAKQQWALENHKSTNDIPHIEDVTLYLMNGIFPKCPSGGTYTIGRVDQDPTCSIVDHALPRP